MGSLAKSGVLICEDYINLPKKKIRRLKSTHWLTDCFLLMSMQPETVECFINSSCLTFYNFITAKAALLLFVVFWLFMEVYGRLNRFLP
ncbi:hypothetical protein D0469_08855 [Peribacillus saganii]|uniref:Uncharacterized protein n=1 Tax=Peribacillus saganii TaxID=2303992 RepID=A0A372LPD1_9BACI|nr:hypothetical protein D0469_08855 [Peribacillus saganii]